MLRNVLSSGEEVRTPGRSWGGMWIPLLGSSRTGECQAALRCRNGWGMCVRRNPMDTPEAYSAQKQKFNLGRK